MRETVTEVFAASVLASVLAACAAGARAPGEHPDASAPEAGSPASRTVLQATLSYGANPAQVLDLYTPSPKPSELAPVVVLAHGGLWQSGERSELGPLCENIVRASGYAQACATIDYRYSHDLGGGCTAPGIDTYRAQVTDLAAAYVWIQRNAATYGLDPQTMYVGGHSAGGHLAHEFNLRFRAFVPSSCARRACAPPLGAIGFEGIYDVAMWDAYDASHWNAQFACATRAAFGGPPTAPGACVDAATQKPCWDIGSPRFLAQNAALVSAAPSGHALVIHSPGDDWVDLAEATAFGGAFSLAFPDKHTIVETSGACATGEHNDVLSEASLAACIARFVSSGGTGI